MLTRAATKTVRQCSNCEPRNPSPVQDPMFLFVSTLGAFIGFGISFFSLWFLRQVCGERFQHCTCTCSAMLPMHVERLHLNPAPATLDPH